MLDQEKIGKFIAERRKDQELTQKQLAEQLCISDKAVSKWETGRSLPDNALLLDLCAMLSISVNELLSGERLPEGSYQRKAEENMMNLMQETEHEKKMNKRAWLAMTVGAVTLALLLWATIIISQGNVTMYMDMMSLLAILSVTTVALLTAGYMKDFIRAIAICVGKEADIDEKEIKDSVHACKLAMSASAISGIVITLIGMVTILLQGLETELIGPNISVAILSTLYGLIIVLLILPVMGRVIRAER